jgi:hypothetical protein
MKSSQEIGISGERSLQAPPDSSSLGRAHMLDAHSSSLLRSRISQSGSTNPLEHIFLLLLIVIAALSGCSSPPTPRLGSISVTDPSGTLQGQLTSVVVNSTVAVSISVINDQTNLGVDWNLTCLGSSVVTYTTNVCGTLNPVHVGSNINMLYQAPLYVPIGNTVTLRASVTSDPSQQSSVTLTILPQPITIAFTGTQPPTDMGASGTAPITATVTNDLLAEGANWKASCGDSSCGSFNPALTASGNPTIYTAPPTIPPGGKVKIVATSVADATKFVSTEIAILPISLTVVPKEITVPARGTADLTATVDWDSFNAGVDWEAPVCGTSGSCGSISPTHTASGVMTVFTAPTLPPAGDTVSVTARSTTDPKAAATVKIRIAQPPPIKVSVVAGTNELQLGGTTTATATVENDYNNDGVSWDCAPGTCYPEISTTPPYQVTYTAPSQAPANNLFTVKAVSITDPTKSGAANIRIAAPIAVTLKTAPTTVTAGSPSTFSATVTNDIAPGGVDWAASNCGQIDCGTFNSGDAKAPSHSADGAPIAYTPPLELPATTVTITVTSTASETVTPFRTASAMTTVTPVPYAKFIPFAPSALPVASPTAPILVSLVAVAANDTSNEGVEWTVCSTPASCGAFLVAPAIPPTLSNPVGVPAVYAAKLHTPSGQTVNYLPPTEVPSGGTVTIKATVTVNAAATSSAVIAINSDTSGVTGVALSGVVQAGAQPVSGAAVELYAAGSTGYGSASSPLVISSGSTTVTTAADGTFTIPAGYICPAQTTELYLVALGGVPSGGKSNTELGLMTALGPCSNLSSTATLVVNEVTTAASAFVLAPFIGADYEHIGSSSTNYTTGFANAFAAVNNLVDITKGTAMSTTPAGYGTAPQAEINTLADAISTCAITAGGAPGDGSPCSAYFEASNVSPLGMGIPGNSPTSILQAVVEEAQYPSNTYATPTPGTPLYNIASAIATPPYLPILTSAPNDWSLAISFAGGGLAPNGNNPGPNSIAIDELGDVWITNRRTSSVTELSNLGAPLSPFPSAATQSNGGFTAGGIYLPSKVAIDLEGNAWILNVDSSLTELNISGNAVKGTPFSGGGTATAKGMAIDGQGYVWVVDVGPPGDLAKYAGFNAVINGKQVANGSVVSPAGGYTHGINDPNGAIAIDGSGTVWVLNEGNYSATELNSSDGGLSQIDYGYLIDPKTGKLITPLVSVFSSLAFGDTMVIDNAGDVFVPNPSLEGTNVAQTYELLAGGSAATDGGAGQQLSLAIPPTYAPIAIDGSGNLWQVTYSSDIVNPLPAALAEMSGSGGSVNSSLSAPGFVGPNLSGGPGGIAVDGSGNVWVIASSNGTVTEFIGVASPAVTPVALGEQTKSLGKKP